MITDYDRINFTKDHLLMWGNDGWYAINKHNHQKVTPDYSTPSAVVNFVVRLLHEEMDNNIENMLTET